MKLERLGNLADANNQPLLVALIAVHKDGETKYLAQYVTPHFTVAAKSSQKIPMEVTLKPAVLDDWAEYLVETLIRKRPVRIKHAIQTKNPNKPLLVTG